MYQEGYQFLRPLYFHHRSASGSRYIDWMPSDDIAGAGAGEWGDGDKKLGLAGESGASITASRRITATATSTHVTEVFSEAAKYGFQ